MTWIRPVVGCLVAVLVLGPFASPGAEAAPCERVTVEGEWATIPAPDFTSGAPRLAAYAVNHNRPTELWATNGISVMGSTDGGCSWSERFSLEVLPTLDQPISSTTASVQQIVIPEATGGSDTVYLVVQEKLPPKVVEELVEEQTGSKPPAVSFRARVIKSSDDGSTWREVSPGPTTAGNALRLRVAPSDPSNLYLLIGGPSGGLYASSNGGDSWELRSQAPMSDFQVDDLDPQTVWAWGGPLRFSTNGGRDFVSIEYVPAISLADTFRGPGDPYQLTAFDPDGGTFFMTKDGGKTWPSVASPSLHTLSVAYGGGAEDMVMSINGGAVFRFQAPYHWIEITPGLIDGVKQPEDAPNVVDVQIDRSAKPSAFGLTPDAIMRYAGLSVSLPPLVPQAPVVKTDVSLEPGNTKIRLGPGESKTVRYRLGLPPQPTPLDVFFLMDTTHSMSSSIKGLQHGLHRIAQELADAKIDVQFGLGEYKDYPIAGYGDPTAGDFPYRLSRAVGPVDPSLNSAIERMQASGGGVVKEESQLTALYQAATGVGEPGCVTPSSACVAPGQQAQFRPDAYKVMINITDAGFEDSAQHPGPPFALVANALKDQGVLQVGLAVFGPFGLKEARVDLERMAQATDTLAPAGGVDCDGDGRDDIAPGEPLVCDILDQESDGVSALAGPILAALAAITDEASVELVATSGNGSIASIAPAGYPSIDVTETQELGFEVTYECPSLAKVTREDVELVATLRGTGIAGATATVVCGPLGQAVEDPEELPPVTTLLQPLPLVAAVPVPPPPPPPAPVSNTQPQPNPHLQGAAAQQEQQQSQVATVAAFDPNEAEEQEFAFSTYHSRGRAPDPALALLYLSAAAMTVGAAAYRLRTRVATKVVRQRW
ncbi:MAG: hypothetical protein ACR2KQ_06485 [Actinomycetota bacterium]